MTEALGDNPKVPRHFVHSDAENSLPPRPEGYTRFVLISDNHAHTFPVPDGDVLLHAGDLTQSGTPEELRVTVDWMCSLPHPVKIMIAGNHDYCLDEEIQKVYKSRRIKGTYPESIRMATSPKAKAAGMRYLQDEMAEVQIREGGRKWRIWGSPWSAAFCSMAFNAERGKASQNLYADIPDDTDILVSHGPPHGIFDRLIRSGEHVGCDMLLARTRQIKPKLHVWGHIHEDRGTQYDPETGTLYVNAANAGTWHRPVVWGTGPYQPYVVDLRDDI